MPCRRLRFLLSDALADAMCHTTQRMRQWGGGEGDATSSTHLIAGDEHLDPRVLGLHHHLPVSTCWPIALVGLLAQLRHGERRAGQLSRSGKRRMNIARHGAYQFRGVSQHPMPCTGSGGVCWQPTTQEATGEELAVRLEPFCIVVVRLTKALQRAQVALTSRPSENPPHVVGPSLPVLWHSR